MAEKIVVIVRTRDEARNVARFCHNYGWADRILVADGGSRDDTVRIARRLPRVQVRKFEGWIELENRYWQNSHGPHINFLIDWAEEEGADWVVFDDCDCWPNYLLKEHARELLAEASRPIVKAVRLYLWGERQHFPRLAVANGRGWTPGLWAWRPECGLRALETEERQTAFNMDLELVDYEPILPPYCLLHHPWPDEAEVARKLAFYRESGRFPDMQHPLDMSGPLAELPDWAVEDA